jgi:hypothetical protein
MATKIHPANTPYKRGEFKRDDVNNEEDEEFHEYMVSRDKMEETVLKDNDKAQLEYLRLTFLQDKETLSLIDQDTDMRIQRVLKFKAEADERDFQYNKLLKNRENINKKRVKNKVKKLSKDINADKRELYHRKRLLDIKREQARLLSNATKNRNLRKLDGRLRMIKAQNLTEDRELKPLVDRAKSVVNGIVKASVARMKKFVTNEEYEKAQKLYDECNSATSAMDLLTEETKKGMQGIKSSIDKRAEEKYKHMCDRLNEYETSKDIEEIQNLLKDIRIAGDHTNPVVKASVEKSEKFLASYKKELLNNLKNSLGIKNNANVECFGQKMQVETYEMCKFTYNIASDTYSFPTPSLQTNGIFNGIDKEYMMENMKISNNGEKMKFICRDINGKPGTMAWRFQVTAIEDNNVIINKLKVMALSSKTQGSSITWEINGGTTSNPDQTKTVKADLLGSPSIIDFSTNVKGWKWFQIRVVVDPGITNNTNEEEKTDGKNANDDVSNAQLFRARTEDNESSQFSLWVEVVSDVSNLDKKIDKENLNDLIKKCDVCLGSKASRNQLLMYAKEKLLTS